MFPTAALGEVHPPVPAVVVCIGVPEEGTPLFLDGQSLFSTA